MDFRQVLQNFKINEKILSVEKYGAGHINETFIVQCEGAKFILQSLNTQIFPNYVGVMDNIAKVTAFMKKKYKEEGKDVHSLLYLIKTRDEKNYLTIQDKCFRVFNYVENSIVYQQTSDLNILKEAGFGLGNFISDLNDFNAKELVEVIPNFHNTKIRFEAFKQSIKEDKAYRVNSVQKEINFILDREAYASEIVDKIENKIIPIRVTHNDTKLNNFMFDEKTKKFLCLVDLDTIMPGSLLYDFGDAIRIACSTAGEEERDLDKVTFDIKAYEAFLMGFLQGIKGNIKKEEAELLHISAKIMTFEIGMRFLKDYLDGDVYFKIVEEDQNLVRARTQLKMVEEIERHEKEMEKMLYKYYNSIIE